MYSFCYKAYDQNIRSAIVLYNENHQDLWNSTGHVPECSSMCPPAPSKCLVCLQDGLYAVCFKLLEKKPTMEGDGIPIEITNSSKTRLKPQAHMDIQNVFLNMFKLDKQGGANSSSSSFSFFYLLVLIFQL